MAVKLDRNEERVTLQKFLATQAQDLERIQLPREEWLKLLALRLDTTGTVKSLLDTAGRLAPPGTVQSDAEASDGSAIISTPGPMLSTTLQVDSQPDGSIASTALIAAGGGTTKWVIYEIVASAIIIATPGGPAGGFLTFSDTGFVLAVPGGGSGRALGPSKQGTAATPVNVSAAAGYCTASSRFSITVRYRAGA